MSRLAPIGKQNFSNLRENNYFYVDKTLFLKKWWSGGDDVTLITRPRRFGKTLMLDTVRTFFSLEFKDRSDLFEGLEIWKDEEFRNLQGTIPVISLSFADIKEDKPASCVKQIKSILDNLYDDFSFILDRNLFSEREKIQFDSVNISMDDTTAKTALRYLCRLLVRQGYGKPIILLDEYDSPLHEAWLNKYWDELVVFIRGLFNSTFKTNQYLGRGLITGITRVAKESIFSDMNNLKVVSITNDLYSDAFGFTEQEVFTAMDEYGLTNKEKVKQWYDGFNFGSQKEIYNPWSIVNFLSSKKLDTYWANSSSNDLISDLLSHSDQIVKKQTELLLRDKHIVTKLDEQIDFNRLYIDDGAIWSLLLAAGYVKPVQVDLLDKKYEIELTNLEAKHILENKISNWFTELRITKNDNFLKMLLTDNLNLMNVLMSEIVESNFSYFDTRGTIKNDRTEAESFYHGFVLGLFIKLKDRYTIISNHESGFGRYDICMYPKNNSDHGIVIEFKSIMPSQEKSLEKTCVNALKQIKEKDYIKDLLLHDVPRSNIYVYGFAFQGKKVLICGGAEEKIDWASI
ncbi:MAG: AAA family ATPase [Desulfovibrionaceae bacterium]|nr:AAA family ATPase [Desulfovibrionaceae bacterium]